MADSLSSVVDAQVRPTRRSARARAASVASTKVRGRRQADRARVVRSARESAPLAMRATSASAEGTPTSGKRARDVQALRDLPWPSAVLDSRAQLTADDTYAVGRLIVEAIHGGERDTQKSRKEWSLRRLQQEVLTHASFATLARCVQTYETCRALGVAPPLGGVRAGHLLNMNHLSLTKQRALLAPLSARSPGSRAAMPSASQAGRRSAAT